MADLRAIAWRVKKGGEDLNKIAEAEGLNSVQKSKIKAYIRNGRIKQPIIHREMKTVELDEELAAQLKLVRKHRVRPVQYVTVKGKRYIDITPDFIDCGD